jgi:NAD(P)-dependent dehydrogenase (short-subunit alcohol dehydrogenase family)/acyl carrier protein
MDDAGALELRHAPLWGLARSLETEHPDLFGAIVDLDPAKPASAQASAFQRTLSAASRGDYEERWIALRGEAPQFARLRPCAPPPTRGRWVAPDTWLVTGGLGGIDRHVCRWLVERGARRLLIVGRTSLPPRDQWRTNLAERNQRSHIEALLSLEAAGAEVHYRSIDLGDAAAVSALIEGWQAESRPEIRGIAHLAGVTGDQLVVHADEATLTRTFGAKAGGALTLHRLLPSVDQTILFSSIATIVATPGQGGYAAANALLDSLARVRSAAGRHTVSVSWGVWADTGFAEGEGGRRAAANLEQRGFRELSAHDALAALEALVSGDQPHAMVVPADWQKATSNPLFSELAHSANEVPSVPSGPSSHPLATLRAATPADRATRLEAMVVRQASAILKLSSDRLDPLRPLGAQGLDSLMGLELRTRLQRELGLAISATLTWNYPTARAIARHLADRIGTDAADPTAQPASAASSTGVSGHSVEIAGVADMSDADAIAALRAMGGTA